MACYDPLCMDDIIASLDGLHPTKQLTGWISPYRDSSDDMHKRYRQMKKIYYSYSSGGSLKRMYIEHNRQSSEEIMYIHLQKRKMHLRCSPQANSFDIVNNTFRTHHKYDATSQAKIVNDLSIKNVYEIAKMQLYMILRRPN